MTRKRKRQRTKIDPARDNHHEARIADESQNEHLDKLLDDALASTFPASDPVAVS